MQLSQRPLTMGAVMAHFLGEDTEAKTGQVIPGSQQTKCKSGSSPGPPATLHPTPHSTFTGEWSLGSAQTTQ